MKRTITLLFLALTISFGLKAQIIFTDNFNATWNNTTLGWVIITNSQPVGTTSVFQGNGAATFPAFNGGVNDYIGMNFNNTTGANDINTWLITPTMNLSNGTILEFATRTSSTPQFADRLQIRMSPIDNTVVPTGTANVGTYTVLMLDINPNLTTNTSSVVSNGVVNGYPNAWAVYTVAVSGLASPVTGRFAFRYFVQDGGPSGTNSDYIGIDAVKVTNPCSQPVISVSQSANGVCSGNSVTLTATSAGTNAATTYTWSNNQTGSVVVVSPTVNTTYVVSGTGPGNCIGTQTAAVSVTTTPNVSVPSFTVCSSPATSATLSATGATSYSWNTGATTSSIVVTPASTTVYTVTGFGTGGNCPSSVTSTVTLGGQLSMQVTASSNSVCSGATVTLTAVSAATTYSWNTGATTAIITVTPNTTTTYSVGGLSGTFPNVCAGGNSISITVAPSPTLSYVNTPTVACPGNSIQFTASGATSYTWVLGNQFTTQNPVTINTGTNPAGGSFSLILIGQGSNGCTVGGVVNQTIAPLPNVSAVASKTIECINKTVTLTASGAATYAWSGALTSTSNPVNFSTGTTPGLNTFTVTGTSADGCSANAVVSVSVSACVGIESISGTSAESSVYPNPFNNELNVSGFTGKVEVYNAVGQLVISQNINSSESMNTTELSKGAYIVKLVETDGKVIRTIKMMKN